MSELTHKKKNEQKNRGKKKPESRKEKSHLPADSLPHLAGKAADTSDILALQRTVGNKAVTSMIQREMTDEDLDRYDFWVNDLKGSGEPFWYNFGKPIKP